MPETSLEAEGRSAPRRAVRRCCAGPWHTPGDAAPCRIVFPWSARQHPGEREAGALSPARPGGSGAGCPGHRERCGPGGQRRLRGATQRVRYARGRRGPQPSTERPQPHPGAAPALPAARAASLPAQLGEGLEIQFPDLLLAQPVSHPLPLQEGLHGAAPRAGVQSGAAGQRGCRSHSAPAKRRLEEKRRKEDQPVPRGGRCSPPAPLNRRAAPRQGQPPAGGQPRQALPRTGGQLAEAQRSRSPHQPRSAQPNRHAAAAAARPAARPQRSHARTPPLSSPPCRPPPPLLLLLRGRGAAAAAAAAQLPICPLFTAASTSSSSGPSPALRSHPPRGAAPGRSRPAAAPRGRARPPDSAPPPPGGARAAALKRQRPFLGLARPGPGGVARGCPQGFWSPGEEHSTQYLHFLWVLLKVLVSTSFTEKMFQVNMSLHCRAFFQNLQVSAGIKQSLQ